MEAAAQRLRRAAKPGVLARLEGIAGSAAFAYGSILLIQAKVLWGIWEHRDLSAGDTASYFVGATGWADHRTVDPLFSPLYSVFWGSLQWIFSDVYAVTIAHRVLIVLALAALVLAVLRRLLSPGIAWAVALWWVVLPVNYDTINEVHLFSLLPVLAAALVALVWSGPRMRAAVFGILLGGAVLQRNELLVAAGLWVVICAAYEWRLRRRSQDPPPLRRVLLPWGAALAVVALLGGLAIWRAQRPLSPGEWIARAEHKQEFALCQHYAVGYQQRHRADVSAGWQDCQAFMRRDFGSSTPSFFEALVSNPGAMAGHFRWNATLLPYELQLALFDRMSGSDFHNPDYTAVHTGSSLALAGSLAALVLLGAGGVLLWTRRRRWWESWLRPRAWGWAVLGCAVALGLWVALTTHPRPAYLFPLDFAIFAALGMCAMAIADRWPAASRLRAAVPAAAVLALVLIPPHYGRGYVNPQLGPGRGAAAMVSRLEPYSRQLEGPRTRLLGPYAFETCEYLIPQDRCTGLSLSPLGPPGTNPAAWLDSQGADFVYANDPLVADPTVRAELEGLQGHGWRRVGPADPAAAGWLLLERTASRSS